jgi:glycosyltransferase involved in cell wall biosynthesis
LWLTYHPYYKAPDLIGPDIARHFGVAYVTAEASYAGKRDNDSWAELQSAVKKAVRAAAVNICFTAADREGLARIVEPASLRDLAPFIDPAPFLAPSSRDRKAPVRLVTVAMMRGGVKLASYEMLARTLQRIVGVPWTLTVVGDGPQRAQVAAALAKLPESRVTWTGELPTHALAKHLGAADLFVWPGTGEAYGIAYLEAQAAGLPVVAQATGGVPAVVRHGVTGLLTPAGDDAAYAAAMVRLIGEADLRRRLGQAAQSFVTEERSLTAAASRLRGLLEPLLVTAAL